MRSRQMKKDIIAELSKFINKKEKTRSSHWEKYQSNFLYNDGVLSGLEQQLKNQKKKQTSAKEKQSGSKALQLYDQKLLDYVNYQHPKIYQSKSSSSVTKSTEFYHGFSQGSKIKLRLPLEQRAKFLLK